jgi:hypothetical protein
MKIKKRNALERFFATGCNVIPNTKLKIRSSQWEADPERLAAEFCLTCAHASIQLE